MTLPVSNIGPTIKIGPDFIEVENLVIQNPELARLLSEQDVAEQIPMLVKIIRFGMETFQFFTTTAAAEKLKAVSLEITQGVGQKKEEIVLGIQDIATRLTSENDDLSLSKLLNDWRNEFNTLLLKNFDEKNTESIITKFDNLMKNIATEQNSAVLNKLDFNQPDSTVNTLQTNLRSFIRTELGAINTELIELRDLIKGEVDVAKEKNKQANRGKIFENLIFEYLQDIARAKGDIADNPGPQNISGLQGNDEGDLTVQINPQLTGGSQMLFVVECKLRKTRMSDRQLYEELDKGLLNRGGRAGFIITEPRDSSSLSTDFFLEGAKGRAILEMDPLDPDINALRFAYLWARWQCLKDEAKVLDSNAVKAAISSIKMALGTLTTAKSNNTQAKGMLDANEGILDQLGKSVKSEIEELENLIRVLETEIKN